jgi:hypothetical protein
MSDDHWVLDRDPDESDEDYAARAGFWRRELARLVDGMSISGHLKAGRAVLIDGTSEPERTISSR